MVNRSHRHLSEAEKYFANATYPKAMTSDQRIDFGAKALKRRLVGFCGSSSIKTLDEVASALHLIGIAKDLEEGRKIVPLLVSDRIYSGPGYGSADDCIKNVRLVPAENNGGQKTFYVIIDKYYAPQEH